MPGAAIGIDASGPRAEIAFAVGGNAAILADRDGFARELPVPPPKAPAEVWQALFEGARLRAERSLARPATHAAIVLPEMPDASFSAVLDGAAGAAGVTVLRFIARREIAAGETPACAAAVLAEDLAPRNPE